MVRFTPCLFVIMFLVAFWGAVVYFVINLGG